MTDFRHAWRALRRAPGFTFVVVATLGLGIGLNTAIFSVVNAVILRPLPYQDPENVVTVWESNTQIDVSQDQVSAGTYRDWSERAESFAALGAYSFETFVLGGSDQPERISAARVSPSVFDVVGVAPEVGRVFRGDEANTGDDGVVILAHGFWTQRFGADPGVIGRALTLDGRPLTVVGVMPAGFEFPPDADDVQLWVPLAIDPRLFDVRAMRVYNVVGRLAEDVPVERAQAEMDAISRTIAETYPDSNRGWGARVVPALEQVVGDLGTLVAVLAGAAGLVLLIGCVNIANLMLARASNTRREYAIRATLGAGGAMLLRRSLAESVLLVGLGGVAGIALAFVSVDALEGFLPPGLPRGDEVVIDGSALAFAAAAALAAGLLFGLYPALRATRPELAGVLQDTGRGGAGGRAATRVLNGMVAAQVALALVLVLNAGVMIRSFARLLEVDPGFRTEEVMVAGLTLPESGYPGRAEQVQFWTRLVDEVSALPGVQTAGAVSALPMSPLGTEFDLPIRIEGRESPAIAEQPRAGYRAVLPGYFETMGIPLIQGRLIDRFDREQGRPVMVLNESAARLLFPGEDPIGQILGVPMAGTIEIVGVVGDVHHSGLDAPPAPEVFVAFENFPVRDMHLVVHGTGEPAELARQVREAIATQAPFLPITRLASMPELLSASLAQPRFNTALLVVFALSALILAAVGIYGVTSYSVVRRTGEIGIRMALGSDARTTFILVVGETLGYVALGSVAGLAGAFLVSRFVRGMVYEVSPLDPLTFLLTLSLLITIAVVAASVPARRATRVAPASALGGP